MARSKIKTLLACPQCGGQRLVSRGYAYRTDAKARVCPRCSSDGLKTHGESNTRLFSIWTTMRGRCGVICKSHSGHPRYRDRGVTVCQEWAEEFVPFRDWALANGYADDLTLDRINGRGSYSPANCRWATLVQQNRNRSSSKLSEEKVALIKARLIGGRRGIVAALAREFGVNEVTIREIRDGEIWRDVAAADERTQHPALGMEAARTQDA